MPKYELPGPCPPLDPALIRWLSIKIPEQSPVEGEPFSKLMFRGGMREVIRILEVELERQENQNVHESAKAKAPAQDARRSASPR